MSVDEEVSADLLEEVRTHLVRDGGSVTPERVAEALRRCGRPVGDTAVLAVHRALRQDTSGAGPLEPLLRLPGVTDVLVNGAAGVWLDRGAGLERSQVSFPDEPAVRRLAQRLAALGGRRLDDATPHVDVRLPDGTRCHAVLFPIARPGTAISLRVPRPAGWTLDQLAQQQALSADALLMLRRVVTARCAFLISGGTGVGKTSLLSAMLAQVEPEERLVIVEDSGELVPRHPHVVSLEARLPNVEGGGRLSLRLLVRQALRMRPDRLVVGEVRGEEVVDLLAALNTGHEGGCGTIHANSAADVPARLEALAAPAGLAREALHSQLASALDLVLHLSRDPRDGRRYLQEVAVLVLRGDRVCALAAATFDADGRLREGPGVDRLADLLSGPRP